MSRQILVILISALLTVSATIANAGKIVHPGEVVSFTTVDNGEVECRWKDYDFTDGNFLDPFGWFDDIDIGCPFPPWLTALPIPGAVPPHITTTTWWNNGASAAFSTVVGYNITDVFGAPFYSTAGVYNEFTVDDPDGEGRLIDIQVSMVYDVDGAVVGLGAFDAGFGATLEIEEVGSGSPRIVGSMELMSRDFNSGQGLELGLEAGWTTMDANGDSASFALTVQRGRIYRIWLKAEAYGAPWVITEFETSVRAAWHELTLAVAPEDDVADLIAQHDADMKEVVSELATQLETHDLNIDGDLMTHDATIQSQLAQHDEDIKAKLDGIEGKIDILTERQLEIIRIMHTPEGQRQTDVPACNGGPCAWNKNTNPTK